MLELKDISLQLDEGEKGVNILRNINLILQPEKFYAITGPNGGGKSSLAKLIMGMYQPTEGKILFQGEDITDLGVTERAKMGIGYAFQQPPRFKGMQVKDLLTTACQEENNLHLLCDLLADVGLCADEYFYREMDASLSGGEMKRIEIATLLARKPKLAVFDEPEAGIDLWSFQRLVETFSNLHQNSETTLLIISHQERILKLADEVIVMAEGSVQKHLQRFDDLEFVVQEKNCGCTTVCAMGGTTYAK